jgi:hypothetical protein
VTPDVIYFLKGILMQYIIDVTGAITQSGTKKEMTAAFVAIPEADRTKKFAFVAEAEHLKTLSMAALVALYNSVSNEDNRVSRFTSKEKGVETTWAAIELASDPKLKAKADKEAAKAAKAAAKVEASPSAGNGKARTPRADSKQAKLLAALEDGPKDLAALVTASGYDDNNTRTAIGNLRRKGKTITLGEDKNYFLA